MTKCEFEEISKTCLHKIGGPRTCLSTTYCQILGEQNKSPLEERCNWENCALLSEFGVLRMDRGAGYRSLVLPISEKEIPMPKVKPPPKDDPNDRCVWTWVLKAKTTEGWDTWNYMTPEQKKQTGLFDRKAHPPGSLVIMTPGVDIGIRTSCGHVVGVNIGIPGNTCPECGKKIKIADEKPNDRHDAILRLTKCKILVNRIRKEIKKFETHTDLVVSNGEIHICSKEGHNGRGYELVPLDDD